MTSEDKNQSKNESNKTKKIIIRIFLTLAIASVLPFFLFFSTPFDVYAANYNEFVFSFSNYFWVCFGYFIAGTAICFLILFFLPKKAYRMVSGLFLGIAFMMFLQSNFLNGNLSALKGDGEATSVSTAMMVGDIIIWIVVLALFVGIAYIADKKGIVSAIGLVITAVLIASQIIIPISSSITHGEMFLPKKERQKKEDSEFEHMLLTNKNLTTVGSDSNIFVFCIDKMDEGWVEYVYEEAPELFDCLKGFTWFQDHISRYGHTYPSIINMLTERPYFAEDNILREKYLDESFDYAQSLNKLHDSGWKINIFSETFYVYNDAYYLPDFIENKTQAKDYKVINSGVLGFKMVELGLYRTMPFFIKDALGGVNSDTFNRAIEESDGQGHQAYRATNKVVNKWTDNEFSQVEGKGFYFIHTEGLHNAYTKNKRVPFFKENINIINKYISYLKQENLFKDATIIITGDHGNGTPYNKSNITDSIRTAMFIKPSGVDEEDMKISQAQTSHVQLWPTILEQANVDNGADFGTSILETPEGVDQERYFTWHTYNAPLYEYQYTVHGSARNFDNWELTKTLDFKKRRITD